MTSNAQRHPFLDDLADDVVLVSSVLARPVRGRDAVARAVAAGARQYASQTPVALEHAGARSYVEYEVTLHDGQRGEGMVSIRRGADGKVTGLHIAFSPLGVVRSIAEGVHAELAAQGDAASRA